MHLFLPDRAAVAPALLDAAPLGLLGPADPALLEAWPALQSGLGRLFGTERRVLLDPLPVSAWLDAVLRHGVEKRVLVLVTGAGGERLARAAEGCGKEAVRLHVSPGKALEPDVAREFLDGPAFDAVLIPHVEPGTGVLEPLAELAQVWRSERCVVIADVTHTLGAAPILADAWGLDAALGASHLALGLPPGLSFAVVSPRLLDRLRAHPGRGWALDLLRHAAAAERGRALHAPNPQLMGALLAQLERIDAAGGMTARFDRHAAHRARVDEWAARTGARVIAAAGRRAPTVTLVSPGNRRAGAVLHEMRLRGFTLATPLDDASDAAVAFGHMGDVAPEALDAMLDALEAALVS